MISIRIIFTLSYLVIFKFNFIQNLKCYKCNEGANSKCGISLTVLSVDARDCTSTADVACVTFKNKYDSGSERIFYFWVRLKKRAFL
jgi:hypothetical protein